MNGSLIPANTKKATLILGMYRPLPDLAILGVGAATTVALLMIFNDAGSTWMIVFCIPMLIGVLLTAPLPYYHNVLCVLQNIYSFYQGRRKYIWRGWCLRNEFKENK